MPIYHLFVEQAKKLEPRLLTMVIPARWFSGGKGLDEFRASMLKDNRLRVIEDFPDSNEVFPGTQIKGGVCYFLWDKDNQGNVRVTTHDKGETNTPTERPLLEAGTDVFIRYNEALPILKKVIAFENNMDFTKSSLSLPVDMQLIAIVSSSKPFGLRTYYQGLKTPSSTSVRVYQNGGIGYTERIEVTKNIEDIDRWKVFTARAGSGSDAFPHSILGKPFIGEPGSICTETYNYIGPFESEEEAQNMISYYLTRFFRFLVLLHKPTQDANRAVYTFVPKQDFSKSWNDADLCLKYDITDDEWDFIEKMIRPMYLDTENADE
jgi:site-specific DNA-methyltransferase (adenine-specific)